MRAAADELRASPPARRRSSSLPLALLAYGALQCAGAARVGGVGEPGAAAQPRRRASPGLRRHLPPLLLLLALCALIVALARPQRTVAAPQRAANVIMVTDIIAAR